MVRLFMYELPNNNSSINKKMAKRQGSLSSFGFDFSEPSSKIVRNTNEADNSVNNKKDEGRKFLKKWCSDFSWLSLRDGRMFCKICETCPSLAGKTDFVGKGSVAFKKESLTSHGQSKHHRDIRESVFTPKKTGSTVEKKFEKQNRQMDELTMKDMTAKFMTAYTIAKEEMPFTKFKPLIELQRTNGVYMNDNYTNDVKCAEMIQCICDEMKYELAENLRDSMYYSIMIDAGTDTSIKENEAMNIRYIGVDGKPVTQLLGVMELEHAHAEGTVSAIRKSLNLAEFPCLENHLVGFCADGASVNFGKHGGVQKILSDSAPWLIAIWCLPHRLELAVMNMMKKSQTAQTVMDILHLIYKTYHYSPKSRRELRKLGEELGVAIRAPTRVRGTRWSPHIKKALEILLKPSDDNIEEPGQYSVTYQHMEHLASTSSNNDVKGRAKNIVKKMKDFEFCAFAHFVLDLLSYISVLSCTLQSNRLILPTAISALKSCILSLEALTGRAKPNGYLSQFFTLIATQKDENEIRFQGNVLSGIVEGTDLDNLNMDSMSLVFRRRVGNAVELITDGMKQRYDALIGDGDKEGPAKAVKCFDVFNHDKWPEDDLDFVDFGDEQISFLVDWFKIILERNGCSTGRILGQWSEIKNLIHKEFMDKSFSGLWQLMLVKEPYKDDYEDILHLVRILLCLPLSSAQCERTISAINRIKSDVRNSLDPSTVETLIRISSEGPAIDKFDPKPCIRRWFSTKRKVHYKGWPEDIVLENDDSDDI